MSNEVKVAPTPVQRNSLDVALELTQMYFRAKSTNSPDEIAEIFSKFLATSRIFEHTSYDTLKKLLPENLKDALPK